MASIPLSYNIRSLKERKTSTLVAVCCIAGVVAVFIAVMAMSNGFKQTLISTGSELNAMVRRGGSQAEVMSVVSLDQARIIGDAPGVARNANGDSKVTREVVAVVSLKLISSNTDANVQIRGVSAGVMDVRTNVRLKSGRFFTSGMPELLVGKNASNLYQNLKLNDTVLLGGRNWQVVGILDAGGSAFDSEIWCDPIVLNQTYQRPMNIFQSVTVRLTSRGAFKGFKDSLTSDPRLTVEVEEEIAYYRRQSVLITTMINVLGFLVAGVMAVGAVFGALNTMYSAISARASEIATLRALGFTPGNVIISFILESLIIALIGGVIGAIIVLPLNGFTASTMNWSTFSHLAFAFRVTPGLMAQGIIFALLMGFLGGFFPALRAAGQSITTTLRGM